MYGQRPMRRYSRKRLRRYKMYRRTIKSVGIRTRQISTNTIGNPVNTSGSSTVVTLLDQHDNNNINCAMGQMYMKPIPNPLPPSSIVNQRCRQTNHVNYHGIKLNRTFALPYGENLPTSSLCVNWALIQFVRGAFDDVTTTQNIYAAFFRHTPANSTINDDESFDAYASGTTTWNGEMNILPMNPDNQYRIITHRRFILSDKGGTDRIGNNGAGPQRQQWQQCWMKNINYYYKLYKAQSFTGTANSRPENPICEIWWYNSVVEDGKPADVTITSNYYLNTFNKHTTYFSDTA